MKLFGKKSKKDDLGGHQSHHEKMPSSDELHDPILKAVQEQQPWEQQVGTHQSEAITPGGALRDVFGKPIVNPDLSNPARSRDERPLDTIRQFEYSTTGDDRIREAMETDRLGFQPRQDFDPMPRFDTNPYSNNVISFGDPNAPPDSTDTIQENEYFLKQEAQSKKTKRNFIGMKKKAKE